MPFGKRSHAFTLTELLVVVAVIAILTSLLLPALSRAKSKGQSISCVGNLRQLQLSYALYVDDNEGMLPMNLVGNITGYLQSLPGSWVLGNARIDGDMASIQKGTLWSYANSMDVYRCPSDKSTIMGRSTKLRLRSYGIDNGLNWKAGPGSNFGDHPANAVKESEITSTSNIYTFIDVSEASIDTGAFGPVTVNYEKVDWIQLPGERHNRGANLAFVDGHVGSHKWLWTPKVYRNSTKQSAINEKDREDLKWIVQRSPLWHWAKQVRFDLKF